MYRLYVHDLIYLNTMKTVSYTLLRQNLSSILEEVETCKEKYFITRRKHSDAVLMDRDDYESIMETLHLLSSPENARRLLESIEDDKAEKYEEFKISDLS